MISVLILNGFGTFCHHFVVFLISHGRIKPVNTEEQVFYDMFCIRKIYIFIYAYSVYDRYNVLNNTHIVM